jgi:molybdopterin-guanine dinucleotide biosynthesis protein A
LKVYGLVLAGGRSSRFGSDKAFAKLAGIALVARIAQSLNASIAALAVSGGPQAAACVHARLLADPPGTPQGPLAGIVAGLAWAEAEGADWLVTATCDVPLIPADMTARLIAAAESRNARLAIARTSDGPHPLCAVWRPQLRSALAAALADGVHPPVRMFAADMSAVEVLFAPREHFFNINTLADLETAERYLGQGRAHG